MPLAPDQLRAHKGKAPLVALTCYTAPMAELLDSHVDILLVGDSVGTVFYGLPDTRGVTLEMMIAHGQAVMRRAKNAMVVVDLPFGSYEQSPAQAVDSAIRVLRATGAHAVKLEGGEAIAPTIAQLAHQGITVLGHVGLMPQHVEAMGGFRVQGKTEESATRVRRDAQAVEAAGACAMVLEGIEESVARDITHMLTIPTIGIGATPACDGQVLVVDDMLGMFERTPRFVKRYETLRERIERAAAAYAQEVRARQFPTLEYCYTSKR